MINLSWSTYNDSSVDTFNVYRSITGISIPFPNSLQSGDVLQFSATSPTVQRVTITATDITSVVAAINTQGKGIQATANTASTAILLRCTATVNPKLKLYPCTFLTDTGIPVQLVAPKMNPSLVGTVAGVTAPSNYTFSDADGSPYDYYYITSVKSSVESIPSIWQKPLVTPESLCVIEGRVKSLQNNPIVGAEVKMSPIGGVATSDSSGVVFPPLIAYTDDLGRWSLPVLQGTQLLVQIPSVGYNQVVEIPAQSYELFSNLAPVNDYYFSPDGDIVGGSPESGNWDDDFY